MYHDRRNCRAWGSSRRNVAGCGAFITATARTSSGRCMTSSHAITPPQSCPTTTAGPAPSCSISPATSPTSLLDR